MLEWFGDFFGWMETLPAVWAYATLLFFAYIENLVPPLPGDVVIVFAGYLAAVGELQLGVVIFLSTVGAAVGFMSMYAIGYRLGRAVRDPNRFRWLPRQGMDRAERWIHKYGYGVIAANRFLSGARAVISLSAGMFRMQAAWTFLWCTVSAVLWTALISYGGFALGENWDLVVWYMQAYGRVVLIVLGVVAAGFLIRWYWSEGEDSTEADSAAPPDGADR